MKLTTAIYPGSFDPITNGHVDVLRRASKLFENIIIAVLENPSKTPSLPVNDRIKLIKDSISDLKNVNVDTFKGLTVDYARKKNAQVLIRGLRAVSDFEHEMQMAQMNKNLYPDLETIFLVPSVENSFLSSSLVKEVSAFGGDISQIVPESVNNYFNRQT
ncbi:MAG: pantetheine-phosphate adenylyltransferase [Candidatus Gastranaerophilales bacterium]|nr:pantetheine-phosphate adenylyltransferase [Candidatus Gastranaerophilales bacterium]